MNIYLKAGHGTSISPGAVGIISESTENRKVKDSVLKYLRQLGHTVTDVTQDHMDADTELADGVNRANNGGADLFVSIHFNKAYNHYDGAIGSETLVYSKSDNITLDEQVASRIVNALGGLGFVNRGVKVRPELYEMKQCAMASVIVEVCFVEATEDVALYQKLGADLVGKTIAEAISNESVVNIQQAPQVQQVQNTPEVKEEKKVKNIVCYCNAVDKRASEYLADFLQAPVIDATLPFDYKGIENIYAVGGDNPNKANGGVGFSGYTTKYIQGSDRYETLKEVLKFIGKL